MWVPQGTRMGVERGEMRKQTAAVGVAKCRRHRVANGGGGT